jgi:hypothetical protein
MKNYKTIRRLFEQNAAVTPEETADLGMQPEAPMMPAQPQPMLPAEDETSAQADPMTMTVRDFIAKCKEVDPLICMGIESFINKNQMAFGVTAPSEPDLTFSTQVAQPAQPMQPVTPPAPAHPFSMEPQADELNFPA